MMHTIPSPLLQTILNYLDTRPHGEVRRLIDEIMKNAKEAPEEQANGEPKKIDMASVYANEKNPYVGAPE
jgi:hypothetical protein